LDLGLVPHLLGEALIDSLFAIVQHNRGRVNMAAIRPTIQWNATASDLTPLT